MDQQFKDAIVLRMLTRELWVDVPGLPKSYPVRGFDEPAIQRLFGRKIIRYFHEHDRWAVSYSPGDGWLRLSRGQELRSLQAETRLVEPEGLPAFLEECLEIFALFREAAPPAVDLPLHPTPDQKVEHEDLPAFLRRLSGTVDNVRISKTPAGIDVTLFDHHFRKGWGTRHQTLAAFQSDPALPVLMLEHRYPGMPKGEPDLVIDLPGLPKQYSLRGLDQASVRRLFHSDVAKFFEQRPRWRVQNRHGLFLLARHAESPSRLKPDDCMLLRSEDEPAFLSEAEEIFVALSGRTETPHA